MLPYAIVPTDGRTASLAVGAVSAQFSIAMAAGEVYMITSSVGCWARQGTNPTASAAPGSTYIPPGVPILISGGIGPTLAVIQADIAGSASLTRVRV